MLNANQTSSQTPSVRYHTTVYIEEHEKAVQNYAVNHVVKVINGTLESVLHLIGYSFMQIRRINQKVAIRRITQQTLEFELSYSEQQLQQISQNIMKERPTRAHVVEYQNRCYGVIIDEGIARICGQISGAIIPKSKTGPLFQRGIKISGSSPNEQKLSNDEEVRKHRDNGKHFLIVSEKGSLFIAPNAHSTGHQTENKLTLVLHNGYVIIDESPAVRVEWIRTKQDLNDEKRESTQLAQNESIITSFAAVCIGANQITVYGTGSVVDINKIKEFSDCS